MLTNIHTKSWSWASTRSKGYTRKDGTAFSFPPWLWLHPRFFRSVWLHYGLSASRSFAASLYVVHLASSSPALFKLYRLGDYRSVWPIHAHFHSTIVVFIPIIPTRCQSSPLFMESSHLSFSTFRRHRLTIPVAWPIFCWLFSRSCTRKDGLRTDSTHTWMIRSSTFGLYLRTPISVWGSWRLGPLYLRDIWLRIPSHLPSQFGLCLLIFRSVSLGAFGRSFSFSCNSLHVWNKKRISSPKSRSSSLSNRPHWIPLLSIMLYSQLQMTHHEFIYSVLNWLNKRISENYLLELKNSYLGLDCLYHAFLVTKMWAK